MHLRIIDLLDRFAVPLALFGMLVLWEIGVDLVVIPSYVLPAPFAIWDSIVKHWQSLLMHS